MDVLVPMAFREEEKFLHLYFGAVGHNFSIVLGDQPPSEQGDEKRRQVITVFVGGGPKDVAYISTFPPVAHQQLMRDDSRIHPLIRKKHFNRGCGCSDVVYYHLQIEFDVQSTVLFEHCSTTAAFCRNEMNVVTKIGNLCYLSVACHESQVQFVDLISSSRPIPEFHIKRPQIPTQLAPTGGPPLRRAGSSNSSGSGSSASGGSGSGNRSSGGDYTGISSSGGGDYTGTDGKDSKHLPAKNDHRDHKYSNPGTGTTNPNPQTGWTGGTAATATPSLSSPKTGAKDPDACKEWNNCPTMYNLRLGQSEHMKKFLHPCPFGQGCRDQGKKDHEDALVEHIGSLLVDNRADGANERVVDQHDRDDRDAGE